MKKIIILAAGKGTRMGSDLPKALMPVSGKPMLEHLLLAIKESGVDDEPVVVVSPDNIEAIKQCLKNYNCLFALQKEQLGTGHAVACAKNLISREDGEVICFYGDHPLIKAETIKKIADNHQGTVTIAATSVPDYEDWRQGFYHWGRIIRYKKQIEAIIEFKDATEEVKKIKEVNPAFYSFNNKWLWENIKELKNKNAQKEYYLTDLINLAFRQKNKINAISIKPEEAIGVNTVEELAMVEKLIAANSKPYNMGLFT